LRASQAVAWSRTAAARAKPLAAGQGKTVPSTVLLAAVGRNVPCGPLRLLAGENLGSGRRRAGDP
jgi:hypothetical protein